MLVDAINQFIPALSGFLSENDLMVPFVLQPKYCVPGTMYLTWYSSNCWLEGAFKITIWNCSNGHTADKKDEMKLQADTQICFQKRSKEPQPLSTLTKHYASYKFADVMKNEETQKDFFSFYKSTIEILEPQ